jgi:hypothetical protein
MKTHAIRWKSTMTGGTGTGTKLFEQQEAERLANELNGDYPDIDHEAVIPAPPGAEPAEAPADQPLTGVSINSPPLPEFSIMNSPDTITQRK